MLSDIILILFAGRDTTWYALSLALMELSKHPEEQEKLRRKLLTSEEQEDVHHPMASHC